jgi:hypothetical protein
MYSRHTPVWHLSLVTGDITPADAKMRCAAKAPPRIA